MKHVFYKRLREERKKLGLLQKEMAAKLNMPPNTYNGYETGKRLPDMEIISQIADILQVSVDYLLGRSNIRNPYNKTYDTCTDKKENYRGMHSMKIGDKIKQLRKEINMSRAELAQKIDITYYALSKYETNERQPDYVILKNIANLFNVSTDYLLCRSNIRNPYKFSDIHKLSPESQKELEKYIELLKLKDKVHKSNKETSSVLNTNHNKTI